MGKFRNCMVDGMINYLKIFVLKWKLSRDIETSSKINFPRQALNEQIPYGLYIFCDSSVESYEFVAYALNENNTSILFSKPKMVLLNKRNEQCVPPFEFLGVILAFKRFPRILEA